jgi:hypothetical protein
MTVARRINLRRTEDIKMNHKPVAIIAIFILCLCVCGSSTSEVRASDQTDPLSQPIRAVSIKGETIAFALDLLTSEYRIPIGIELTDEKLGPRRKINLELPQTTLKEFLDAVVAKDPKYTWKLEGGVIHVWPVTDRDVLIATLLDTKISHFGVADGPTRYRIHYDILNLPEIQTKLIVADVAPMIFLNFASMDKLEKDVVFEESDLTLRELLDRLAQKTKIRRWVIRRWGDNNEYITLTS